MMKRFLVFGTGLIILFLSTTALHALPSLSSEDIIGDLQAVVNGEKEYVPVIRDLSDRNLFYYTPVKPRLAVQNGQPVFKLLKYQRKEKNKMIEGGILQFAFSLALPTEALPSLKKEVSSRFKVKENKVKLQPLPMKKAELSIYAPNGELIGEAPQFPQVAPTFATQMIPVQINLNSLGADVYSELVSGNTGLPVVVAFSFEGITPACGFKATINWIQSRTHLSVGEEVAAAGSAEGLGIAASMGYEAAFELLLQKKAVKVESLAGEAMTAEQIEHYVKDVLMDKIMNEIAEVKLPEKVDPAAAAAGKPTGLGVGYGYKLKAVQELKVGNTTFDMTQRLIAERQNIAGGFIGIGNYPEEVRKNLITTLADTNWERAFFPLPDPGNAEMCGVSSMDLTVRIVGKDGSTLRKGVPPSQSAKWTSSTGTWKRGEEALNNFEFAMKGLYDNLSSSAIKNLNFELTLSINYRLGNNSLNLSSTQLLPLFSGDYPYPEPMTLVEVISIYNNFEFGRDSNVNTALVSIEAPISGNNRKVVVPMMNNDPKYLIIDALDPKVKKPAPIKGEITINLKKGSPVTSTISNVRDWGNLISIGDWMLDD